MKLKLREGFLEFVARASINRPFTVLSLVFIFTIVAGYFAKDVEVNLSMLAELPEKDPLVNRFLEGYNRYGGLEYVFVLLKSKDIERTKEYADEVVPEFEKLKKYFKSVRYRVDVDFFKPYSLLFLEENEIDDLNNSFSRNIDVYRLMLKNLDFVTFLKGTYTIFDREISTINEITEDDSRAEAIKGLRKWSEKIKKILLKGKEIKPEEYRNSLAGIFSTRTGSIGSSVDEYFLSPDEKVLVIMLSPTFPSENINFSIKATKALLNIIDKFKGKYPDVEAQITGAIPIVHDQMGVIRHDMTITTLIAMIVVLILFALTFRNLLYAFLMGVPLGVGLIWIFAIIRIYPGAITITTSVFGAIIIGLGIDFGIHLISRFNDERRDGKDLDTSIYNAVTKTGKGIITGAITTSAAFYTLLIAYHKGIEYLGFISGTGVLTCLISMFLVVPPLLKILGKKGIIVKTSEMKWLVAFSGKIDKRPYVFLVIVIAISAFMGYFARNVSFDNNFRKLMPQKVPAIRAVKFFEKTFERGSDYGLIPVSSIEEVKRETEKLRDLDSVGFVDSIANYLPDNQEHKIKLLKPLAKMLDTISVSDNNKVSVGEETWSEEFLQGLTRVESIALALKQLCVAGGYLKGEDESDKLKNNIKDIVTAIEEGKVPYKRVKFLNTLHSREFRQSFFDFQKASRPSALTLDKLPEDIKKSYIGADGSYLIYAYPSQSVWISADFMGKFVKDLESVNSRAFGIPSIFYYSTSRILIDLKNSTFLAFIAVLLLVFIDFRNFKKTILTIIPLTLGALWMVGTMPLLGVYFNFVNLGSLALILGIGIDDGVHVMHRFSESKSLIIAVSRVGRAILLTSLTTMAGFGALLLAETEGINSIGEILCIGVGFCFLTTIFGLGTLLGIFIKGSRED